MEATAAVLAILGIVLVFFLILAGIAGTLVGLITFVHLFKGLRAPADESNRINHIRLWWFSLTRPELFAGTFPWMLNDEYDNVKHHHTEPK
jgi:hypothetical protein